jgi:sugar phosphate isomerase/epimerase
MQLGISSYSFGWAVGVSGHEPDEPLGPFDVLNWAEHLGVRVVQFADNMPLHELPDSVVRELVSRAEALGVTIELGTRGVTPAAIMPYVRLAHLTGSRLIRTIVDTPGHAPDPAEIVRLVQSLVPHLEEAGVVLAIENHDRLPVQLIASILQRIASRQAGVCLDTANSFGSLEGPAAVVDALGPWTVNLHLKDFAVERLDHRMGFSITGRPLGSGQLDIPWLLGRLSSLRRDPNAIIEQWTPWQGSLAETVRREAEWVEASVAYARQLIPD